MSQKAKSRLTRSRVPLGISRSVRGSGQTAPRIGLCGFLSSVTASNRLLIMSPLFDPPCLCHCPRQCCPLRTHHHDSGYPLSSLRCPMLSKSVWISAPLLQLERHVVALRTTTTTVQRYIWALLIMRKEAGPLPRSLAREICMHDCRGLKGFVGSSQPVNKRHVPPGQWSSERNLVGPISGNPSIAPGSVNSYILG